MSYPQFGYTHPSTAQLLVTSQSSSPSATSCCDSVVGMGSGSGTGSPTCATGTTATTGPNSGPSGSSSTTVCSCQYDSRLLGGYSRLASTLPVGGLYSAAYADQGYVSLGADPSAFYSPLNNAYELKDGATAWSTLAQPATYYPYDPTMAAYPYGAGYGGMDLNAAARRKNATRETTSTLKAWLYEHKKNPYPTKGEKIMLAIITKMTLTQVSTWFANARRRLKKENKMTWEPRNRVDDDEDAKSDSENNGTTSGPCTMASNIVTRDDGNMDGGDIAKRRHGMATVSDDDCDPDHGEHTQSHCDLTRDSLSTASDSTQPSPPPSLSSPAIQPSPSPSPPSSTSTRPSTATTLNTKPRIWSLAHTATCTSPPLGRRPTSPTSQNFGSTPSQVAGQGMGSASTNAMATMAAERRLAFMNARTWMTASAALGTLGLASQYHSLVNNSAPRTAAECPNPSTRSSTDAHKIGYPHQQSLLTSGVVKSNIFSLQGMKRKVKYLKDFC